MNGITNDTLRNVPANKRGMHTEYGVFWPASTHQDADFEECESRDAAKELIRRYPEWSGELVHRAVTVDQWSLTC